MEMGSYIESVLNRIGMKPIELANRIGVDRSTVTRYLKGTRKISMEDVPKIANAIGINPMELLMDENDKKPTNVIDISQRTVKIPVLGEIACGDPILAEENYEDYRDELAESLPAGELVYLKAKGDSMSPTIPSGSFVLVRAQSDVENGEIAAVLVNGNTEATLKRVKKQGDVIILMPDNSAHQPYIVDKNNPAKIIGKAIRFTQDL
nr:LexA family transcriptional regulator [Psychrobacillus psychrodurans]